MTIKRKNRLNFTSILLSIKHLFTKPSLASLLVCFLVLYYVVFFMFTAFDNFEIDTLRWRFLSEYNKAQASSNCIVLGIDQQTITKLGRWPWDRDVYAELVEALDFFEADSITFDIFFPNSNIKNPEADIKFAEAVEHYQKRNKTLTIATILSIKNSPEKYYSRQDYQRLKDLSLKTHQKINAIKAEDILDPSHIQQREQYILMKPYERLFRVIKSVGLINASNKYTLDVSVPLVFEYKYMYFPTLGLATYLNNLKKYNIKQSKDSLQINNTHIPVIEDSEFIIKWYKPPSGSVYPYQVKSLDQVIDAYNLVMLLSDKTGLPEKKLQQNLNDYLLCVKDNNCTKEIKEFSKLIPDNAPIIPTRFYKNKHVFIGYIDSSAGVTDTIDTPVMLSMPGVMLHANLFDNLQQNDFIRKSSQLMNLLLCIILITVSLAILKVIKNNFISFLLFLGFIMCYFEVSFIAFSFNNLWIPVVKPIFLTTLFFIFGLITQNLLTEKQLTETYKLATTDGLTGLYNHRFFQEKMSSTLADVKRREDSFSIILLDIDHFKKFNDSYGHRAGDKVLIEVGKILRKNVRNNDIVCRYGGEEMCIILDKTRTAEALDIAQKIVTTVGQTDFKIHSSEKNEAVHVTISAGVANYPDHGQTAPELIEFADQGLYRAKAAGKNRVGALFESIETPDIDAALRELEPSTSVIKEEIEKIIPVCNKYNIDVSNLLADLLIEILNKNK